MEGDEGIGGGEGEGFAGVGGFSGFAGRLMTVGDEEEDGPRKVFLETAAACCVWTRPLLRGFGGGEGFLDEVSGTVSLIDRSFQNANAAACCSDDIDHRERLLSSDPISEHSYSILRLVFLQARCLQRSFMSKPHPFCPIPIPYSACASSLSIPPNTRVHGIGLADVAYP